jgi:dolichyl-phosphate-mannose--protein O-mannosyl transferase
MALPDKRPFPLFNSLRKKFASWPNMLALLFGFVTSVEDFTGDKTQLSVGYYTLVKLQHFKSSLYLSSLVLQYQNGSNQQVVRGITKGTLAETYWTVFPPLNDTDIPQGRAVDCGSVIRLQHVVTNRWLHSHPIPGHFGSGHEVSGFDGSDSGDNWELECDVTWTAASQIKLKHIDTGYYLAANATSKHEPDVGGEFEVFASEQSDHAWVLSGGVFVDETE